MSLNSKVGLVVMEAQPELVSITAANNREKDEV
jgi:hypothetical protein